MRTIKVLCYCYHSYLFRVFLGFRDREVDGVKLQFYFSIRFRPTGNRQPVIDQIGLPPDRLFFSEKVGIRQACQEVRPDLIVSSTPHMPFKEITGSPKLLYVGHGFWYVKSPKYLREYLKNPHWKRYDRLMLNKIEQTEATKLLGDRVRIMNTTPQIDYLSTFDPVSKRAEFAARVSRSTGDYGGNPTDPLSPDTKFIMLVHNPLGVNDLNRLPRNFRREIEEYRLLLRTALEFARAHGYQLISRYRRGINAITEKPKAHPEAVAEIDRIHREPDCTFIYPHQNIVLYDLFFSDLVIIQGGGTSLIEAFYQTPRVVRAQLYEWTPMFEYDRYPALRQARTPAELTEALEFLSQNSFSDDYQRQRDSLIREYFLDPEAKTMPQIEREIVDLVRSEAR